MNSSTVIVLHAVGAADAGWVFPENTPTPNGSPLPVGASALRSGGPESGPDRSANERGPGDRRREKVNEWAAAIRHDLGDPEKVAHLLRATELSGVWTPLASIFDQLPATAGVELILLATDFGDSTQDQANILSAALARHPAALGRTVVGRPAVLVFHSFAEPAVIAAIGDHLVQRSNGATDTAQPVTLTWGSAAISLSIAAVVAVIESGRPLRLRASKPPYQEISLTAATGHPGAAAWLVRYGQPALAYSVINRATGASVHNDASLLASIATLKRSFAEVSGQRGRPSAEALAAWVRADLRSGDGLAGLAVRAFVEADYRRRLNGDPDTLADYQTRHPKATFGELVKQMRSDLSPVAHPRPADSWLIGTDVEHVMWAASRSAHNLTPLDRQAMSLLGGWIGGPDLVGVSLGPLALPSGRVAIMLARGFNPDSFLARILTAPLGAPLARHLQSLGVEKPDACALIIGTDAGIHPFTGELNSGSYPLAINDVATRPPAEVFGAVTATADHTAAGDTAAAADLAARWLHNSVGDVDALIIALTSEKDLALGVLHAAMTFSTTRAVPVFLQSHVSNKPGEGADALYHRITGYLGANAALLDAALAAARRFSFDLVANLMSLTTFDQALTSPVVTAAEDIAKRLRLLQTEVKNGKTAVPLSDLPERAADRSAVLTAIAESFDATRGSADLARLVHLAREVGWPDRATVDQRPWRRIDRMRNAYGFNRSHGGPPERGSALADIRDLADNYHLNAKDHSSILPKCFDDVKIGIDQLTKLAVQENQRSLAQLTSSPPQST